MTSPHSRASPPSPMVSVERAHNVARTADSAELLKLVARQTSTDPVSFIPAASLTADPTSTTASSANAASSSTSDTPLFPSPTGNPDTCESCDTENNVFTKKAIEGALIVVAVALILALTFWRTIRLRRRGRPLGHFFRASPSPSRNGSYVSRPAHVPRTTGLPPTQAPHASLIYDSLTAPAPLMHRGDTLPYGPRRGRGRRTYAGDIDGRGRRGTIAHPDDPNEFLPEYDDKDRLPRYQDLEMGAGGGGAYRVPGDDLGRMGDAGRMAGVGALLGMRPNRDDGHSDTNLLAAASEDEHAYPPAISSAGSHEGHDDTHRNR
ncbi:hypothetical protein C2E23DRAFT_510822 [Lenzites betulinus]|nr:hypothetical protein C2E23DRAFT_510822 [Lenzites betulinus]